MATDEHKLLASFIKAVHENLRESAKKIGPKNAWEEHLQNRDELKQYAESMRRLAEEFWESNAANENSQARSRIHWIIDYCMKYFQTELLIKQKRLKEMHLLEIYELIVDSSTIQLNNINQIKILDVGSCFNPLRGIEQFDVTAIDISPADDSVIEADFLQLELGPQLEFHNNTKKLEALPINYFHCVVFSLLLEYLPSSELRIHCCSKAYQLLKFEGILIIITPDSQHVGKNAKLMKNWRYTLARMGFSRIQFEKLPHITCMVFRKSLSEKVTQRWAELHKEPYMTFDINTPQDQKIL